MTDLLNILSFLTGSSQETLLNAKAEMQNYLGNGNLSNGKEREFVFEKLANDMFELYEDKVEIIRQMPMIEIVGNIIEEHMKKGDKEFLQIFNRVLVYFYKFELSDTDTFIPTMIDFSKDFEMYIFELSEEIHRYSETIESSESGNTNQAYPEEHNKYYFTLPKEPISDKKELLRFITGMMTELSKYEGCYDILLELNNAQLKQYLEALMDEWGTQAKRIILGSIKRCYGGGGLLGPATTAMNAFLTDVRHEIRQPNSSASDSKRASSVTETDPEAYIKKAQKALADDRLKQAINEAEAALKYCAKDKRAHYLFEKAKILYSANQDNECAELIENNVEVLYNDLSLETFQSVLQLYLSTKSKNNVKISKALRKAGIPDILLENNDKKWSKADFKAKAIVCKGSNQYELAVNYCDIVIKVDKNDDEIYFIRGYSLSKMGNDEAAINDYDKTISLNRHHDAAYNNRALIYSLKGKTNEAIADFKKAVDLAPTVILYRNNYASELINAKRFAEAYDTLEYALINNKSECNANTYFHMGLACDGLKRYFVALKHFKKATSMDSTYTIPDNPCRNKAIAQMKKIALINAITTCVVTVAMLLIFLVIVPNMKYNNAIRLFENKQYKEANTAFEKLGDFKDSSAKALECKKESQYEDATSLFNDKRYAKSASAFSDLGEFRDSEIKTIESKYLYASALFEKKHFAEAADVFNEVGNYKDSAEMEKESLYEHASILYKEKKYEEAASVYRELGDFKDSQENGQNTRYQYAKELYIDEQYSIAKSLFSNLGDYKDSKEILNEIIDIVQSESTPKPTPTPNQAPTPEPTSDSTPTPLPNFSDLKPLNVKIDKNSNDHYIMTWDPIIGADMYEVYLKDADRETYYFTSFAELVSNECDLGLFDYGDNFEFYVVGRDNMYTESQHSDVAYINIPELDLSDEKPVNLKIYRNSDNHYILTWDPIINADSYDVFWRNVKGTDPRFKLFAEPVSNECDLGLYNNGAYFEFIVVGRDNMATTKTQESDVINLNIPE